MRNKREQEIQIQLCKYVAHKYPYVLFNSDLSGLTLTYGQANVVNKMRSCNGFPDFMMYHKNSKYNGLFIEIKKEGEKILRKDQKNFKTDHLRQQNHIHVQLRKQGFKACFGIGLDKCIEIVDEYMMEF